MWRRLRANRGATLGLLLCALLALSALTAELLASDLPLLARVGGHTHVLPNLSRPVALLRHDNQSLAASLGPGEWMIAPPVPYGPGQPGPDLLAPPSAAHWLGTDAAGRDVAARLIHGTRAALLVGFGAVGLATLLGLLVGLLAGWWGGAVDALLSRLTEVVMTFPTLILLVIVQGLLERPSLGTTVLTIALLRWPEVARLVRIEVMRLRRLELVEAVRAMGATTPWILTRHVLPHCLPPVLVTAAFAMGQAILLEGALSYLGFGAPPPTATWGEILRESHQHGLRWWLTLFPGLAIFVAVTGYNLVAEGFRVALDPRAQAPGQRRGIENR